MGIYTIKKPCTGITVAVWEISESLKQLSEIVDLTEVEKATLNSFGYESRKTQWLASRALTQEVIGKKSKIAYLNSGKPYLLNNELEISISHSGKFVSLITNENSACGIDIEKISTKIEKVKHKFLHPSEHELIASNNQLENLCIIWGAKESLYKMNGATSLNFSQEIIVKSLKKADQGELTASIIKNGRSQDFVLDYEKIEDFILVNTL